MGKQFRGILIYVLIIAAVFAGIYFMTSPRPVSDEYTFSQFQSDLNDEVIDSITITQNNEIPTGVVMVTFKDKTKKQLYVENVGTITDLLKNRNFSYTLNDVTRSSYFVSTILPMLIMFIIFIVLMVY